jgi:hypothetical protein
MSPGGREEVSVPASRLARWFGYHAAAGKLPPSDIALRAGRELELAARSEVCAHIRRGRESGLSWHGVGGRDDLQRLTNYRPRGG